MDGIFYLHITGNFGIISCSSGIIEVQCYSLKWRNN